MKDIDKLDNIKMIDFGLARDIKNEKSIKSLCSGSPFYIAPEILNRDVFVASDIWSLGIVMYLCLTGQVLFGGSTKEEIMRNILYQPYDLLKDPLL